MDYLQHSVERYEYAPRLLSQLYGRIRPSIGWIPTSPSSGHLKRMHLCRRLEAVPAFFGLPLVLQIIPIALFSGEAVSMMGPEC